MKWLEEEKNKVLKLFKEGKFFVEIAEEVSRSKDSIRGFINKLGYKESDFAKKIYRENKKCLVCNKEFISLKSRKSKFCSNSCKITFTNKNKTKKVNQVINCLYCNAQLNKKEKKYCNNRCQGDYKKNINIKKIENGDLTLNEVAYKKYLIYKYGNKCMLCSWSMINPTTGLVPVQIHHIDGNYKNNKLINLQLLCPNCHSLTSTHGFLNKGKGRPDTRIR